MVAFQTTTVNLPDKYRRNTQVCLWRAQSVDNDLARDFSYEELTIGLKHLRHGIAPGPDNIHAEFLIHAGDHAKEWLRKFFNKCLLTCKLPRIWRRATVIAILKPNKPKDEPKSYRPISLLCTCIQNIFLPKHYTNMEQPTTCYNQQHNYYHNLNKHCNPHQLPVGVGLNVQLRLR